MINKKKFLGFTLIEMLVVMAIILIMAALISPVLSKARESGRTTKCSSNLHQLQLAVLNSASDSGGGMPGAICSWSQDIWGVWNHAHGWISWSDYSRCTNDVKHESGVYSWRGETGRACITNGKLFYYIKGGEGVFLCPTFALNANCKASDARRSYSMNTDASSYSLLGGTGQVDKVLFADDSSLVGDDGADGLFTTNELARWHNGKGNVVYADGHVDKL